MNWIVDPISDANGFHSIRIDDGTENGDTDAQPVATVYKEEDAQKIVNSHNKHFTWSEKISLFEIARLALQDADFFDMVAEEADISDEEMVCLREKLQKYMENS